MSAKRQSFVRIAERAIEKPPRGRPRGTGSQIVYETVRDAILSLRFEPGRKLDEAKLEAQFSVSRTPIREALIRLASEGLVEILPNRGARVTQLDVSALPEMFEALELAQRAVSRWAAARRSDDDLAQIQAAHVEFAEAARRYDYRGMSDANLRFHMSVAAACGNRIIADNYASLLNTTLRLARTVFSTTQSAKTEHDAYFARVVAEHAQMCEAIAARDSDQADQLALDHTRLFKERVTRYVIGLVNDSPRLFVPLVGPSAS